MMTTQELSFVPPGDYYDLQSLNFRGHFVGLVENKDYKTKRAVFEIDEWDKENYPILDVFEKIRNHFLEGNWGEELVSYLSQFVNCNLKTKARKKKNKQKKIMIHR